MWRVAFICGLYYYSLNNKFEKPTYVLSVDEKTGIQALEPTVADKPSLPGHDLKREYEYIRHGTTCLTAGRDVGSGKIIHYTLRANRKEKDFLDFIRQTVKKLPKEVDIIFVADQLNTHKSESLVKWIAKEINYKGDLGKKNYKGILKDQQSRKQFLENQTHRIRFAYTPKHCSWVNQIECWFSILNRHVIKHGDFSSVKELKHGIVNYIDYYNRCLAKPFNWRYKGQLLNHLKN
jgi:transposase